MILMHDKTYRKRLEEIKMLNELYENTKNQLDKLLVQKKDLQYQIDYLMFSAKSKQQRINKAIDYINTFDYYIPEDNVSELLNILKGSDNE